MILSANAHSHDPNRVNKRLIEDFVLARWDEMQSAGRTPAAGLVRLEVEREVARITRPADGGPRAKALGTGQIAAFP